MLNTWSAYFETAGVFAQAFQQDAEPSGGAAAGKDDFAAAADGLFAGIDQPAERFRGEDPFGHGGNVAVDQLKVLHAVRGGTGEFAVQMLRQRTGLFRRQKAEVELFFVFDEIQGQNFRFFTHDKYPFR